MKLKPLALFVGAAFLAIGAVRAQTPTEIKRPALYISEFELTDPEGIKPYSQQVEATFTPFSGRYVVRGGKSASLEGAAPKRVVMIAFDSMAQAQAWYDSPAYQAIRQIRHQSATSRVYLVEGLDGALRP